MKFFSLRSVNFLLKLTMRRLLFWIQQVGFSITELADLFSVSTSFFARLVRRNTSLSVSILRMVNDPLFEPFEIQDVELGLLKWHNPNPEVRTEKWKIRLISLQIKLDKALKNKTLQDKQYRKNGLILHHFEQKRSKWVGRTDVLAKWWDYVHSAAEVNQRKQTLLDQEELDLEILSLQTQIEKIKNFLS